MSQKGKQRIDRKIGRYCRQTDRYTHTHTHRQTDRQTDRHMHVSLYLFWKTEKSDGEITWRVFRVILHNPSSRYETLGSYLAFGRALIDLPAPAICQNGWRAKELKPGYQLAFTGWPSSQRGCKGQGGSTQENCNNILHWTNTPTSLGKMVFSLPTVHIKNS